MRYSLYIVWVIAMLASVTSIYLIEVQHWDFNRLGWYQLICMLPVTVIAGIAAWDGFFGIARYLIPQTIVGLGLSIYQLIFQCSSSQTIQICNPEKTILTYKVYFNLPALYALAFLLINILLFITMRVRRKHL